MFSASAVLARLEPSSQVFGSKILQAGMPPGWRLVQKVSKLCSLELTQKNRCDSCPGVGILKAHTTTTTTAPASPSFSPQPQNCYSQFSITQAEKYLLLQFLAPIKYCIIPQSGQSSILNGKQLLLMGDKSFMPTTVLYFLTSDFLLRETAA